ncbi:Ku protein [Kitasatospora sp. NPDC056138]|uniref:Ku protein n=1 Tax=Kitasatospora sp. NPDC056138 TaxID=3345724 RepID=UPI0035DD201A
MRSEGEGAAARQRVGADPTLAVTRSSDSAAPVAHARVTYTRADLHKVIPPRLAPHFSPKRTKIYALLQKALERSGRAGLALFSMRGKEYLPAVRAESRMLVAHTMHFAGEVRELIEAKASGQEISVSQGPAENPTNVVDLMEILNRSIETAHARSVDESGAEPRAEAAPPTRGRARETAPSPSRAQLKAVGGKKSTSTVRKGWPAAGEAGKKRATASKKTAAEDLGALTKAELYRRATEFDTPQRSTMTRDQLQDAVKKVRRRHLRTAS